MMNNSSFGGQSTIRSNQVSEKILTSDIFLFLKVDLVKIKSKEINTNRSNERLGRSNDDISPRCSNQYVPLGSSKQVGQSIA